LTLVDIPNEQFGLRHNLKVSLHHNA